MKKNLSAFKRIKLNPTELIAKYYWIQDEFKWISVNFTGFKVNLNWSELNGIDVNSIELKGV